MPRSDLDLAEPVPAVPEPVGPGVVAVPGPGWQWCGGGVPAIGVEPGPGIVWSTPLPGPGSSSPIWIGDPIFVTCYSGFDRQERSEDFSQLRLHTVCIDRGSGAILWTRTVDPALPQPRGGRGGTRWAGYASGTPCADERAVYAPFDNSGVFAYSHDGELLWQQDIGSRSNGWGNASSAIRYGDLVIVNASQPAGSLIALSAADGSFVWQTTGVDRTWSTPVLCRAGAEDVLVLMVQDGIKGFDPASGAELWFVEGMHDYVANTPVCHDGILYCASRNTHGGTLTCALALGERAVDPPRLLWQVKPAPEVSSPVYHEDHLYFKTGDDIWCLSTADGSTLFREQLEPRPRSKLYASPLLAGDRIYFVSQEHGTYVVAAEPSYRLLAHNVIAGDTSVANASPAPLPDGRLLLRSDGFLHCIGTEEME